MPLPNRVDPFGELFTSSARGTLFGNRGGRFHRDDRTLGTRRWASRQWICCVLDFKDRHREVWAAGYTELFFLDEVTALAAGHRPCFECRRRDAQAFARAWADAKRLPNTPRAGAMDVMLHAERLNGNERRHRMPFESLPDGACVALDEGRGRTAWAVRGASILRWTPSGYAECRDRPRGIIADVITPPAVVSVLAAGYRPRWHDGAISPEQVSRPPKRLPR